MGDEEEKLFGLCIGDDVVIDWESTGPMLAKVVGIDAHTGSVQVSYTRLEPVCRKSWCRAAGVRKVM